MSNDDIFNDSDEGISLYSSKKVTDTFKDRLKKIAANNCHPTDIFSNEDHGVLSQEVSKNNGKGSRFIKEDKIDSPHAETIEIFDDDLSDISIGIDNDESLEESVEIVEECNTTSRRRSERLRKKNTGGRCEPTRTLNFNSRNKRAVRSKKRKEKQQRNQKPVEITLDVSEDAETDDELNPELTVKVIWKSVNVKKFQIRKFQKLSHIYQLLSKEENIPEDKIILTFNSIKVNKDDTLDSLNLQVYHFLDGGVLSELSNSCHTSVPQNYKTCSDSILLKLQDGSKKKVVVSLGKSEKLKVAMIKCSEQIEVPLNKIKFFFDGELLKPSDTPESIGLENEEVIDFKVCT